MSHHKLVRALVDKCRYLQAEVDRLERAVGEAEEDVAHAREQSERRAHRAEERLRQQQRDADYARQQAESRASEQRDLVEKLDRARRYGSDYDVDRLTRRLRCL